MGDSEMKQARQSHVLVQYVDWSEEAGGFEQSSFDEELFEGAITREELAGVIAQLSRSRHYPVRHVPWTCWLAPVPILLLVVGYSMVVESRALSLGQLRGLVFLCLLLMILLPGAIFFYARRMAALRASSRPLVLKRLLNEIQNRDYRLRGVELRINNDGTSLIIDCSKLLSSPLGSVRSNVKSLALHS